MTIAELFINLGVKGDGSAKKALEGTQKGLKDISSMSLEAKAAIAAVVYGLQKLMSQSAQAGTNLVNFGMFTGLSTKRLQEWQYAARQAGVSADEITGSIKTVQTAMTDMLTGKGAPAGMGILSRAVGFDMNKARDTFYVMQKLQEFARTAPTDIGNQVLKSFSLGEGTIAAMRRGVFNQSNFAKAPTYSNREAATLDRVNAGWANLGTKFEMMLGKLNAAHGGKLISDLSKVADQVFKLINAFAKLADTLKIFEVIGRIFDGWTGIFKLLGDAVTGMNKGVEEAGKSKGGIWGLLAEGKENISKNLSNPFGILDNPYLAAPKTAPGEASKTSNTEINQTITHVGDAKDTKAVKDLHKNAISNAYFQSRALNQAN